MKTFALGAIAVILTGCSQPSEVKTGDAKPGVQQKVEAPLKAEVPQIPRQPLVIPQGSRVTVRTNTAISTKTATNGETFSGSLAEPVLLDGKVVIPKNSPVEGVVAESDEGGRVKGVATLSLRLTHISVEGKRIPVQTSLYTKAARTTKKKDAVKVGIGAGIGAAIGALAGGGEGAAIGAASGGGAGTAVVLATRGDPAVVAAESVLSFRLTSGVTIPE